MLDEREHLPLDRCAVNIRQQVHHDERPQEMQEVIQLRAFVQPVYPVHDLLPVQTPRDARIVTPGHFPTYALCQVLRDLIPCLLYDPPPSTASQCPSALEESGLQIKAPAYVGIFARMERGLT